MKALYRPLPDNVTIKNSSIEGLGLFSTKSISEGHNFGITHIKDSRFENGYSRTPLGGFFNHSTTPNCEVIYEGDFIYLKALKDIDADVELTVTYTFYDPQE